jgi:hypothetical protein
LTRSPDDARSAIRLQGSGPSTRTQAHCGLHPFPLGLLSYSDDEDERPQPVGPHQPVTSTSSASSAIAPRRPVAHPSSSAKLALKHQLPNLVRRPAASGSQAGPSGTSASASASAYPNSPLRRPFEPSPDTTPTRPSLVGDEADELEDDGELVRQLLRPPPLRNGEGWDDEYGLRRLSEEARLMARQVDPALQVRRGPPPASQALDPRLTVILRVALASTRSRPSSLSRSRAPTSTTRS